MVPGDRRPGQLPLVLSKLRFHIGGAAAAAVITETGSTENTNAGFLVRGAAAKRRVAATRNFVTSPWSGSCRCSAEHSHFSVCAIVAVSVAATAQPVWNRTLKAPTHFLTDSCDPISCYGKPVKRTSDIGLEMISLVCSTGCL